MVEVITQILSVGTLTADIFIIIFLVYWLLRKKQSTSDKIIQFFKKNGVGLAFVVALLATLISLYYSEIVLYAPCKLCWIQRIFMYPQVLLLGIAWWKNDEGIKKYSLSLTIIGAVFAVYHYLTQQFPEVFSSGCSIGEAIDCTFRYTFQYGYITFPLMSLTSFLFIIILVSVWQKGRILVGYLEKE